MAQWVKNPPAMQESQETRVQSLGGDNPLEERTVTHSSILARKIPWTEEPGGLASIGWPRIRVDVTEHTCRVSPLLMIG